MKRVTLIEFSDANLSGFAWSWRFMLTKRTDGSFSLTAKQSVSDPPSLKIPHRHPLRTGEEIYKALFDMLSDAGYGLRREDVPLIGDKISKLSKEKACEFVESQGFVF